MTIATSFSPAPRWRGLAYLQDLNKGLQVEQQLARRVGRNHRGWWVAYILLVVLLVASAWVLATRA